MQSLFKTAKITIDGIDLTIKELGANDYLNFSGKSQAEIAEALCRSCVVQWSQESAENIRANVPARVMREIVDKVFEISGLADAKNFEPAPGDGSSTV